MHIDIFDWENADENISCLYVRDCLRFSAKTSSNLLIIGHVTWNAITGDLELIDIRHAETWSQHHEHLYQKDADESTRIYLSPQAEELILFHSLDEELQPLIH